MAEKVFNVELGAQTRTFKYDWASARPFFKKQGAKPYRFLFVTCLGFVLDAKGNLTHDDDGSVVMDNELIDDDARVGLLALGLGQPEEKVSGWVRDYIKAGNALPDLVWTAVKAALYAGVTGKSVDLDAEQERAEQAKQDAEGKDQTNPEASSTA